MRLAVPGAGRSALRRLAEEHRPGLEVEEEAEPPEALDRDIVAVIGACREALQPRAEPHAAHLASHRINAPLMADHYDGLVEQDLRNGASGVLDPVSREVIVPCILHETIT